MGVATTDSTTAIKKKSNNNIPDGFKLVPPDGNYAWTVAFACFVGGLLTVSALPVLGVLLHDIIPLYKTNTASVSWIPSLYVATGQFLALITTVIINTFGVRKSTMIGGLVLSFGMTSSYFVDRIELLCVTYGIIIGFGTGLSYTCFPIVLSQYFKKYYGVVIGLLNASFASSRLVFTPLTQYLLEEYGCRSVFLILGANLLHIVVAGMFFQPVRRHLVLVPIDVDDIKLLKEETPKDEPKYAEAKYVSDNDGTENVSLSVPTIDDMEKNAFIGHKTSNDCGSTNVTINDRVPQREFFCKSWWRRNICDKIDFSLLHEPCFYIVCAHDFLMLCINIFGNIYMFSLGVDKGCSSIQLASMISSKAVVDIVSRVAGPAIVTYFNLSVRKSFIAFGFINGIILTAIVFVDSYSQLMAWGISSSIFFGTTSSLSRVLIVETMGAQRLASVMGLSSFIEGHFMLPMAPMLGWIRDTTGSFANIYLILALLQFVLITLWIIKPYVPQKRTEIN